MKHCTQCGHVLGLGRFCTSCGHPVASRHADPLSDPLGSGDPDVVAQQTEAEPPEDWRTDTAERAPRPVRRDVRVTTPPAPPRVPPAVVEVPLPPRFPLFADEVAAPAPEEAEPVAAAPLEPPSPWAPDPEAPDDADYSGDWDADSDWEDERRPRTVWVVVGALVVALVLGAWFVGQTLGGDEDKAEDTRGGSSSGQADEPVDHTRAATARAPRTAPSTQDVDGNATTYDAANMLDGEPETAWRAAGAGTSLKLVFTFPKRTRISEVGLVNGYAKAATDAEGTTFDWYAGHRRITQVTWNLGGGEVVRQDLVEDRALQTVEVEPVEVRRIVLKIVATTDPGAGATRRDFVAISDVLLAG